MANTKIFREKYGYTQKDLAIKFNIPLRTIQNWDYRNSCPQYVLDMISKIVYMESSEYLLDSLYGENRIRETGA